MFCDMKHLFKSFCANRDGNFAMMFGIALIPIAGVIGAALDYSRGNGMRAALQASLDSAVLAAAIDGGPNWKAAATNVFAGNARDKGLVVGAPVFSYADGVYSGQA